MTVEGAKNTSMAGSSKVKVKVKVKVEYTGPKSEVTTGEGGLIFPRGEAVEVDSDLATRLAATGNFKKVTK